MLLVTGASGHSARFFFETLAKRGHSGPLRAAVRDAARSPAMLFPSLHIETVVGDLNDPTFLKQAMHGVATVLHTAHIRLSPGVVAAAQAAGVGWCVLVHTTGRFSRFRSASADYITIEDALIAAHENLTILRPTMIYGSQMDHNMWRLIDVLARTPVFPVFGNGRNLMQPVHAADLGRAYADVIAQRAVTFGRQYNLPGRAALSYDALLRTVAAALGRRIWFPHVPMCLSLAAVRAARAVLGARCPVEVEQVLRLNEDKAFGWEEAARDFGYDPMRFAEGVAQEVAEYRSTRAKP